MELDAKEPPMAYPGSKNVKLMAKDEAEEDARESRKMDPEALCISRITRLLDEFEGAAPSRIVAYLASRYTVKD